MIADNWDGDVYKGTPFNILNLIIILFVAVPLFGLIFAWQARLPPSITFVPAFLYEHKTYMPCILLVTLQAWG